MKAHTKQTQELSQASKKKAPRKNPLKDKEKNPGALSGDWSAQKAILQERLELHRADRVQIQTQIISGHLVLRDMFSLCMGRIYATDQSQTLVIEDSIGHIVGITLGIPENENHRIRRIMSELAYDMMEELKSGMETFIKISAGNS